MSDTTALARQVERISKQIDSRQAKEYVKRSGNNFVIYVAKLSIEQKQELSSLINDFFKDRRVPLRTLKKQRKELLLQILKSID